MNINISISIRRKSKPSNIDLNKNDFPTVTGEDEDPYEKLPSPIRTPLYNENTYKVPNQNGYSPKYSLANHAIRVKKYLWEDYGRKYDGSRYYGFDKTLLTTILEEPIGASDNIENFILQEISYFMIKSDSKRKGKIVILANLTDINKFGIEPSLECRGDLQNTYGDRLRDLLRKKAESDFKDLSAEKRDELKNASLVLFPAGISGHLSALAYKTLEDSFTYYHTANPARLNTEESWIKEYCLEFAKILKKEKEVVEEAPSKWFDKLLYNQKETERCWVFTFLAFQGLILDVSQPETAIFSSTFKNTKENKVDDLIKRALAFFHILGRYKDAEKWKDCPKELIKKINQVKKEGLFELNPNSELIRETTQEVLKFLFQEQQEIVCKKVRKEILKTSMQSNQDYRKYLDFKERSTWEDKFCWMYDWADRFTQSYSNANFSQENYCHWIEVKGKLREILKSFYTSKSEKTFFLPDTLIEIFEEAIKLCIDVSVLQQDLQKLKGEKYEFDKTLKGCQSGPQKKFSFDIPNEEKKIREENVSLTKKLTLFLKQLNAAEISEEKELKKTTERKGGKEKIKKEKGDEGKQWTTNPSMGTDEMTKFFCDPMLRLKKRAFSFSDSASVVVQRQDINIR